MTQWGPLEPIRLNCLSKVTFWFMWIYFQCAIYWTCKLSTFIYTICVKSVRPVPEQNIICSLKPPNLRFWGVFLSFTEWSHYLVYVLIYRNSLKVDYCTLILLFASELWTLKQLGVQKKNREAHPCFYIQQSGPLYWSISSSKRQLLIQNAAARVLSRAMKSDHITPVLKSLHRLPVSYRIDFKVLPLVLKCLNGLDPGYTSDMLKEYRQSRALGSIDSGLQLDTDIRPKFSNF